MRPQFGSLPATAVFTSELLAMLLATWAASARDRQPWTSTVMRCEAPSPSSGIWRASSMQQAFVNIRSGRPRQLPPPVADYLSQIGPQERAILDTVLPCTAIGSAATVRDFLSAFVRQTGANELMVAAQIFDHTARKRSYEIAAQVRSELI